MSSESKVIERVAKYHRAWNQQKEKSGLLQLLFLLFCKARFRLIMLLVYCCLVVFFVLIFVLSLSRRTFKLEFKALIFFSVGVLNQKNISDFSLDELFS